MRTSCPIALAGRRVKAFGTRVTASVNSHCITFHPIDPKKVAKALNGEKWTGWVAVFHTKRCLYVYGSL